VKQSILVIGIILSLFTSGLSFSTLGEGEVISKIIYVDDDGTADYIRIQDAIDNASDGNTIYVYSGIYNEKIKLYKSIILQGEDKNSTIIDGDGLPNQLIELSSDESIISGFRIQNGSICIYLDNANNNTITENIIVNKRFEGFRLYRSNNNSITENIIYKAGLNLEESTGNTIENNKFESQGITITFNLASEINHWNSHTIRNNSINGRPIRYYTNSKNIDVPNDVGQVILANCSSFSLQNLRISNLSRGIQIGFSTNNIIRGNELTDTDLMLGKSSSSTISENNFSDADSSVYLVSSTDNLITENTVENNDIGILLEYSSGNTITRNNILDNRNSGVLIVYSLGNMIKNNNFIKNDIHARFDNSIIDLFINSLNSYSLGSFRNKWSYNYWDDWLRNCPRPIKGTFDYLYMAQVSMYKFDWHPAKEPYDIN
jgi:parallel beta-helix repeat protein